jgi:peptide/nickel transport system substrate-binding protein
MDEITIALEKVDFPPAGRVTDDSSILTLQGLVCEPLLRWKSGGRVEPGLLGGWTHTEDARRWRFEIRPGATFHDGKPCTAEDVLALVERVLEAVDGFGMKGSYARYLADARFSIPARGVIALENPEPIADILDILSEWHLARPAAGGAATLGTGRYRVSDVAPPRGCTLERVAATGDGPRRIHLRRVPQAEERLRLLRAGDVDAATNLERCAQRLPFDEALSWQPRTNTLSVIYYLNCFTGLFTSPAARLAVNHAVDVQAIIEDLFHGLAVRGSTVVSPHHLGHAEARTAPIPFDPARARALLADCRTDGELVIRTPEHLPEKALAVSRVVREALAAIGLAARIDVQTDRPEYAREIGRKQIGDMAIFDSSPCSTYRILDDKISSRRRAVWWQGFDDPALEPMIRAANHAVTPDARAAAYGRCLARLNAAPPWLYLFHPVEVMATRPACSGLTLDCRGVVDVAA